MIYFSDKELDDFLLEDIYRGDLTTHALGLEKVPAKIEFKRKNAGVVAGISVAERLLKKLGITSMSFDTMVLFGDHAADPHGVPGDRKLRKNEWVLFDLGTMHNGYASDMTRTIFFGEESAKDVRHQEIFNIVKTAHDLAIQAVKPGMKASEIDAIARNYITEKGYGEFFTHRTGHHIGLECHEYGDISSVNETKCEPGMIFSIEPGIYLPGEFGVRIEDLVLVTEDGCEVLNKLNKELVVIGE